MDDITEETIENADLPKIKEVLRFLVTQEKLRQAEVEALKEMISGVDTYAKEYVDGQNFNEFNEKYGEKLAPYGETLKATEGDDFDIVRGAYDTYKDMEEPKPTEEEFIDTVVQNAEEVIQNLKEKLGLPADTAVEIKDDGNGETEVKVDADGDGEPEKDVTEEATAETETTEEEENTGISEEDKADIDDAVDNYTPRH
ncbi:MAG: hypothetical protein KBT21_10625 [Treponema sp.]|nr:hypothetical protein [Candidatus Treponema merdequi]